VSQRQDQSSYRSGVNYEERAIFTHHCTIVYSHRLASAHLANR